MATAQYGTLALALGSPNGPRKSVYVYLSDAAGAVTYPDGSSSTVFSGNNDVYIVDFMTPAAMATMVTGTCYVGGTPSGYIIALKSNASTVIGRQLQTAPLRIPKGQSFAIIQA